MRIAVFTRQFPSVSETFILQQITGLIDRGHEVDIYAEIPDDAAVVHGVIRSYRLAERTFYRHPVAPGLLPRLWSTPKQVLIDGVRAPAVMLRALDVLKHGRAALTGRLVHQASTLIRKNCPCYDVIHAHFAWSGVKAVQLRQLGAISGPVLTTFHGIDVNVMPRRDGGSSLRLLRDQGEGYLVSSEFIRKRAIALGFPSERIQRLPVGVSVERFHFRERHLDSNRPVRLLTVGRLVEVKGIDDAIRGVAAIRKDYPAIEYRIVGDGPMRDELFQLVRELDLQNVVRFLGNQPSEEVVRQYDWADLFMLTSVIGQDGAEEGQGLALLEAQACGLPLISTQTGGIPESVREGESGLLVPARDVSAIAESLTRLIRHPQRWPKMGRAGRAHVKTEFNLDHWNDQLVGLYRSTLERYRDRSK